MALHKCAPFCTAGLSTYRFCMKRVITGIWSWDVKVELGQPVWIVCAETGSF